MTHKQVYDLFSKLFPFFASEELLYFPNGKNSIRVRGISQLPHIHIREDIVFSCNHNGREWRLETMDNFIKSMKEGVKRA
jgi:hypothetical protein